MAVMNVFITIGGVALVVIVAAVVILVAGAVLTAWTYAKSPQAQVADAAVAFVLSKLDLRVGTRDNCIEAHREYEIPSSAVAEAIINAVAHRDYVSSGSVQVELFSDRLVVRNPGTINPALTKKRSLHRTRIISKQ